LSLSNYPFNPDIFTKHYDRTDLYQETVKADDINKNQDSIYWLQAFHYTGKTVNRTWENGVPIQEKFYDSNNNLIKQIDYTWDSGFVQNEVYILNRYGSTNQLLETKNITKTYSWVNGIPTEETLS
jgi:hypothetical protein